MENLYQLERAFGPLNLTMIHRKKFGKLSEGTKKFSCPINSF